MYGDVESAVKTAADPPAHAGSRGSTSRRHRAGGTGRRLREPAFDVGDPVAVGADQAAGERVIDAQVLLPVGQAGGDRVRPVQQAVELVELVGQGEDALPGRLLTDQIGGEQASTPSCSTRGKRTGCVAHSRSAASPRSVSV